MNGYGLLVVDDEKFVVKSISESIDWAEAEIDRVFTANHAEEAKKVLEEHTIHVVLADIEMRGGSGLELVSWINEHVPGIETILLTGHANFDYAHKALQLDCFDYILKPVDYGVLVDTVRRALGKVRKDKHSEAVYAEYERYRILWMRQLPALVERFWQEVLAGESGTGREKLIFAFQQYELPLSPDCLVLPILVSVEQWNIELSAKDEVIMEFALRNAAAELLLKEREGHVVQERSGAALVLLYRPQPESAGDSLIRQCREYIEACSKFFRCEVSCYVGRPVAPDRLPEVYRQLLELERVNITAGRSVFMLDDSALPPAKAPVPLPSFTDWGELLRENKTEEFKLRLQQLYIHLEEAGRLSTDSLVSAFHGLAYLFTDAFLRRGISLQEPYRLTGEMEGAIRSAAKLRAWADGMIREYERRADHRPDEGDAIGKAKAYIVEHLHEEISRQELAKHVYLNPSYLSRLFRKETGKSISEYVLEKRMLLAAEWLKTTDKKISDISEALGFNHFSHFRKMFKKTFGVPPQEFRNQSRSVR